MRLGQVEGSFILVGYSRPMLKISWRSIKIWLSYEGLNFKELLHIILVCISLKIEIIFWLGWCHIIFLSNYQWFSGIVVRALAFLSIYCWVAVLFLNYLIGGEGDVQWTCWCIEEQCIAASFRNRYYLIGSSDRFVTVEARVLCIQRLCVQGSPNVQGPGRAAGGKPFSFILEKTCNS